MNGSGLDGMSLRERIGGDILDHPLAPPKSVEPIPANSVPVYEVATGRELHLAPDEAAAAFRAGKVNLIGREKVGLIDAEGNERVGDTEEASDVLAKGGTLAGVQEAHHAERRQEMGGLEGGALALGGGLARGASFGISDELLNEEQRETLNAANEEHGVASAIGEVGGSLLMPGAGAAGRLGSLARGALAREGAGLGSRMLARGAGLAAEGGAFGGLSGLEQTLSENALHEGLEQQPELTGEQLVAGMGHGAIVGAVLGGITGAGGEALGTGVRRAIEAAQPKMQDAADALAWRDLNAAQSVSRKTLKRVSGGASAVGRTAREIGVVDPSLMPEEQLNIAAAAKGRTGQQIRDMYARSGATGTARGLVRDLDDVIAEVSGGEVVAEDGTVTRHTAKAGLENVEAALKTYRQSLIDKLTANAPGVEAQMGPDELALFKEEQRLSESGQLERADQYRKIRENKWGAKSVKDALDHPVPLSELWEQRVALDTKLKWESAGDVKGAVEKLRDFRAKFQKRIEDMGEQAAKEMGGEFASPLRELNNRYANLGYINQALETKVVRGMSNNKFGLTAAVMQSGGMAGAAHALMSGHPLVAAGLMGAGAATRWMQVQGPRAASWALGRAAALDVAALHAGRVDSAIERAMTSLATRETARAASAGAYRTVASNDPDETREEYESRAGNIRELAEHPELAAGLREHFAPLADTAPQSAQAAAGVARKGLQYLAGHLPPELHLDPMLPGATLPPSLSQQQQWLRRAAAVDDPLVLLEQVKSLRLDPATVDAVKTVYPSIYKRVVDGVHAEIAEDPKRWTRAERLALSALVGHPLVASAKPAAFAAAQAVFAQAPSPGGMGRGSQGSSALKQHAQSRATSSERVSQGG